eukprot:5684876-Prymnesium_polylepis.1
MSERMIQSSGSETELGMSSKYSSVPRTWSTYDVATPSCAIARVPATMFQPARPKPALATTYHADLLVAPPVSGVSACCFLRSSAAQTATNRMPSHEQ